MPITTDEGIKVLTPRERNIYARFVRMLNSEIYRGIVAGHSRYYLDFLRDNGIKHDTMKQICKVAYDYVPVGHPFARYTRDKVVSSNGVFYLTSTGGLKPEYGFSEEEMPPFDEREQIEEQKRLEKEKKEQEKLEIEKAKAQLVLKLQEKEEKKRDLFEAEERLKLFFIDNPQLVGLPTRAETPVKRAKRILYETELEIEALLEKIPEEEKTQFISKPKPQRKRNNSWSKEDVINLLTQEPHKVARMLGTGYDLFEPIHGEWINRWLLNPSGFRVTIHQAHRDSYKSSALRLFTAIFMILYPLKTVIIIRKSEDAVKELVNGVSKILDTPLFNTFVNILYPDIQAKGGFKKSTDTALAIDTNLNVSLSGEYQLRALGLGSPLTGKHSSLIITDDIVTTDDRVSPAKRAETISKYQELMNILSNNKGFSDTRILNIGTPWHEDDAFSLMEKGLLAKTEEQTELEKIPQKNRTDEQNERIRQLNMLRGKFVYNCYQTGLMTQEDIEWKKRVLNDDALFAANYMLNLVSDDECPFPRINNVGKYTKSYFSEAWEVFAQLDCGYGGEDSTALSIGCHNWETNETVVYGRMWHKISIDENYLEIAEIMYDCGVQTLFLENNADKGLMGQKFRELGFNVVSYHEHSNKDIKIVSTIRPFWRETGEELLPSVQFIAETDEDYLKEIHNYKKGVRHDDAPDSLSVLLLRSNFGSLPVRVT